MGSTPVKHSVLIVLNGKAVVAAFNQEKALVGAFSVFTSLRMEQEVLCSPQIVSCQGPVLGWIHALQCYREIGLELPVNFKFCFEGMEESGSEGLDKMLMSRQDTKFMQEVDYCCISDKSVSAELFCRYL